MANAKAVLYVVWFLTRVQLTKGNPYFYCRNNFITYNMLTDNFFNKLEREVIPNALEKIATPDTKGFWCDGLTTSSI